ncbi:alpha/beta fold hydrolase [Pontibacter indicus]|uniref:Proline iminopeptidase n=1 Tax=Pontibacter indicus TaxID=1317125 RepID=A0A1R3WXT2_9BACT|nr:alpha/beta hydrolase [Pontibacter indicus]SIT82958.1 proline iminopeptidase [Pontibacter indicus]
MRYLYSLLLVAVLFSCTQPAGTSQAPESKVQAKDGEQFYTLNGIKHWVKIKGSENSTPPIVIVHGGPGGNNYNFERTVGPKIEAFATVVYYEQRGSGRSEAPKDPDDYLLQTLISDLEQLRDALGVEKMTLLGYSFGAELALRYAIAHPERVEKLILSSPAELSKANMLVQIQGFYAIGDSTLKAGIEQILQDSTSIEDKYGKVWNLSSSNVVDRFLFLNPELAQKNRQMWQESKLKNTGLMAKVYLKHNKADLVQQATGLKTPTLIISGVHDKNGGLHTGLALKQVLSNSMIKLYENSAHFPDMEEEDRFAADVKMFTQGK